MTSKIVKQNVAVLKGLIRGAKEDVRDRVNQVVSLYEDRKISQRETAINLINGLMSENKRTSNATKKRFDKKYGELEARKPLNERMATNRDKKDYSITFLLYGLWEDGRKAFQDNYKIDHQLLNIQQPITVSLKKVRDEDMINRNLIGKYVLADRYDYWIKSLKNRLKLKKGEEGKITKKEFDEMATREGWKKAHNIDDTQPKRKRFTEKTKLVEVMHDTALFEGLRKKLILDTTKQHNLSPEIKRYLTAIKITDISDITNRGGGEVETQRNLKDGNEKGLYHFTINTELNIDAEYFVDAIDDQEHTNGECWINLLIDHYKDTLMSKNKWESKRLTREKILKLMNKTEEEFKEYGASVEDMKPVFEEFKVVVRLYNCFSKRVFTFDPDKKNKNISALYGLIKGNHIYTINDNINSIAHREIKEDLKLCASTDFHLNSKEEPVKYEMFNSVDDVMKILKDNPELDEINLVSKRHLNNVYCEFKRCCYEPSVIMNAGGNISSIKLKFNKTILNIRSQDLINCAVERSEYTDDASVFNRVNEGMFKFNKALFNPHHKSYYHKDDKQIFDIAHSIASCGYMDTVMKDKGVELDRNKAYTKGTMDITKIPIFCEFDIWKKYDYEKNDFNKMNELTLYLVKSKVKNMFFNRSYNLIYGMYLKEYYKYVEIIYYKIPSKYAKVDYKKIILDLWNMKFDDDEVMMMRLRTPRQRLARLVILATRKLKRCCLMLISDCWRSKATLLRNQLYLVKWLMLFIIKKYTVGISMSLMRLREMMKKMNSVLLTSSVRINTMF